MKKMYSLPGIIRSMMFLLMLCPVIITHAENIRLTEGGSNSLTVRNSTAGLLQVVSSLNEFSVLNVKTDLGVFYELRVTGYSSTYITGSPELPVLRKLIEIPLGAEPRVRIISSTVKEYSLLELGINFPIIPAQPPVPKNNEPLPPFEYNTDVYNHDDYWGEELVTAEILGILRDTRIARLSIAPLQYNPVAGTIRVYESIEVEIIFKNADITATQSMKVNYGSPYFDDISRLLLNPIELQSRDTITKYPVKYVIVSDPMFQEQLQPFIAWKIQKGFTVVEAYTDDPQVGTSTTSIKAYLQDLYLSGTPEDPAPSFVLFVGDVEQIPAWNLSGESDLKYCEYTNDYFPEVYYGRFSAQDSDQLQPQIDKTLQYEQFTMPDPSFLGEVVMIGGMDSGHGYDWANGQINYGTENYFNEAHGIFSHTYLYPASGGQSAQIIQDVSNGVAFANYTAHGSSGGWADPSFSTSDINTLQNQDKYGLLVGNACSTNEFANSACFGEALLRAENKGALGYIGGSNSTYWDEDYYWGVGVGAITEDPPAYEETTLGAYDRTFHDHGEPQDDWYVTQDQMIFAGNLAVTEGAPSSAQYYWDIYCLMGDPSVMIYFGVPLEMTVLYDPLMPLASTSFTITTEPYAYVAISKEGILHGAAMADETGTATVALEPITVPGEADIVVTAQNRQPFIGSVVVASPDGPYVLFNACAINDNEGNGNQQADFSENIMLDITLKNVGNSDAVGVISTLLTENEYVTITQNEHSWPDIPSDSSCTETGAFAVTIHDSIPDLHKVPYTIEVTDGADTWNSTFFIYIHAPVLAIGAMTVDDSEYGNNNGRLDPGEMADVHISVTNEGSCDIDGVVSYLTTTNSYIELTNNDFEIGLLEAGTTQQAVYNLTVDPSAPIGEVAEMDFTVGAMPYESYKTFVSKIGLIVEDFETGNFEAFEWEFGGNTDWTISETAFSGNFSAVSGNINDMQSTILQITLEVLTDDTISFYRKVSSEPDYDYLKFYIDDMMMAQWAGESGWERVAFAVAEGERTFKWEYDKDYSVSNGSDCAWIDYVVFPSIEGPVVPLSLTLQAVPDTICMGSASQLMALPGGGSGSYTFHWTPGNTLSDTIIFNPVATPEETTLYSVEVTDGADTIAGEITIVVLSLPEAPVIEQSGEELFSNMELGNQWYIWGEPIPGATQQYFTPTATGEYYATHTGETGCESVPSNAIYFIYTGLDDIWTEMNFTVFPNPVSDIAVVSWSLDQQSAIRIALYNSYGQEVKLLLETQNHFAGNYSIKTNLSDLPEGLYYCKLESSGFTQVRKIILIK